MRMDYYGMKAKCWLLFWILLVILLFAAAALCVYHVDPYFHYHKPYTDKYFYQLNNERSQNDGISRHFEYNAIITGTSMAENFRVSEMDELFECISVKTCFQGGTYKEINDNLARALKANQDLKTVVRCLDLDKLIEPADFMRTDLGKFPIYLYDDNPFNDVKYVLNREILLMSANQITEMTAQRDKEPGITSFDDYYFWQRQPDCVLGKNNVCPYGVPVYKAPEQPGLSENEKDMLIENITRNVTDLAVEYPDVEFYYYFSPYSIIRWLELRNDGCIYKITEAERIAAGLILRHENIRLFSFSARMDIICDLNNYMDKYHYASWVNSLILKWMRNDEGRLTGHSFEEYFTEEYKRFMSYDYAAIYEQPDYEADYYAGALLNMELTGAEPMDLLRSGLMKKTADGGVVNIDLQHGHRYLMYRFAEAPGEKIPAVSVYDESGKSVGEYGNSIPPADGGIHMHVIDLSAVKGTVTIVFRDCFPESTESGTADNYIYDLIVY